MAAVEKLRRCPPAGRSADRQERDLFALFIAGHALGARVEHRFAIDPEQVMMVSVVQGYIQAPRAINLAFHRVRDRVPVIEIAHHVDFRCRGRQAKEGNRFGDRFG